MTHIKSVMVLIIEKYNQINDVYININVVVKILDWNIMKHQIKYHYFYLTHVKCHYI